MIDVAVEPVLAQQKMLILEFVADRPELFFLRLLLGLGGADLLFELLDPLLQHRDLAGKPGTADPELLRLYNEEVPVIAIDGRKAFKYRLDMNEFLKRLVARR